MDVAAGVLCGLDRLVEDMVGVGDRCAQRIPAQLEVSQLTYIYIYMLAHFLIK